MSRVKKIIMIGMNNSNMNTFESLLLTLSLLRMVALKWRMNLKKYDYTLGM